MNRGGPWPHVGLAAVVIAGVAVVADPAPRVEEVFSFADADITESSGLALSDGLVLTVNDSGADPIVYAVDPESGETVGRTTYTTDEVEDVEALAVGPDGTVWVGDIGDNGKERSSVAVYAVPPVGHGDRTVDAPRYELTYEGGARDAETLLADPRDGRLYVASKQLLGGDVYVAPRRLREDAPNVLRRVSSVNGLLTDGTFTADGRHALLRGYGRVWLAETETWRYLANMPLPDQRQGEGIARSQDPGSFLISSEGARTPVLSVPLAENLVAALEGGADGGGGAESPPPSGSATADPDAAREASASDDPGVFNLHGRAIKLAAVLVGFLLIGVVAGVRFLRGGRRRSRSRR